MATPACVAVSLLVSIAVAPRTLAQQVPDPNNSYFVPQVGPKGTFGTPIENGPFPNVAAIKFFRMCPNNDGGTSLANNARIEVVVMDGVPAPIAGIPASDICLALNGGTLAQGFSGPGADSIIANGTWNSFPACPDFPANPFVPGTLCVQADGPTDANGVTFITFTGATYDTSGQAVRDPTRKWGHYDTEIPVFVRGVKIAGKWNSTSATGTYTLRIKNFDSAGGLGTFMNQGEVVTSADFNSVATLIGVNNAVSYWKDFNYSGDVDSVDFNMITQHVTHSCQFPDIP